MFKEPPSLLSEKFDSPSEYPFDAYVVLDFEATCDKKRYTKNQEVIEFPLVVVNPVQKCIESEFQRYVKPRFSPKLSKFCIELTGITQEKVDRSAPFAKVYTEAMQFLSSCGFGDAPPSRSYCLVTCGDWDLKTMLPAQLKLTGGLDPPKSWRRWCNIKEFMKKMQPPLLKPKPRQPCDLLEMLTAVGLSLQGRHHSGIDDCRNIAAVLCELLKRGCILKPTYEVDPNSVPWRSINLSSLDPSGASPSLSQQLSSLIAITEPHSSKSTSGQEVQSSDKGVEPTKPSQKRRKRSKKHNHDMAGNNTSSSPRRPHGRKKSCIRAPVVLLDDSRDAIAEILHEVDKAENLPTSSSLPPERLKNISRLLSYILRHGADEVGVPITLNGYVPLEALLVLPKIRQEKITQEEVAYVVKVNEKKRFNLAYGAEDKVLYICATQGHSLKEVTPDLLVIKSPEEVPLAVHGTNWEALKKICNCGYLSPMSRQYIHFAKGLPQQSGVISGMRSKATILLYLDVESAISDGIPLFESTNKVILTSGVPDTRQLPIKYIKKIVNRETGEDINLNTL
ncbi:unnamed protein product [Phytomonas sp. Hart1]|nr:unnamed protein product [Phytomonas sp. Hart1]|eukprot:CCW66053.1 unnamed protein product [Phytomonas sp. isolate Hart1]